MDTLARRRGLDAQATRMNTGGQTHVTLELFGAFVYVVKDHSLTVLFVDGRQSALGSDGKTLIPSHVPVIATSKESVPADLPEGSLVFDADCKRVLWFLDDQDITIEHDQGGSPTPFCVVDNERPQRPHPVPANGEEEYFGWVADMAAVVTEPHLRDDVLTKHPKRISARLTLEFGRVSCAGCIEGEAPAKYASFSFRPLGSNTPTSGFGALAKGVSIDLGVFPSLLFRAKRFKGKPASLAKMKIKSQMPELTITIFNSPVNHIVMDSMKMNVSSKSNFISHFELFYRLLDDPPYPLLVPFAEHPGPTAHNVSCPPAQVQVQP